MRNRLRRSTRAYAFLPATLFLLSVAAPADAALPPPFILWNSVFGGPFADVGESAAVGPDGNPVVTGRSRAGAASTDDIRTIKYDATTGTELWSVSFDSGDHDEGMGVAVGPDGHPVVAGRSQLIKYDGATGSVLWLATFGSFSGAVAIGADNHPVVARGVSQGDHRVIKRDGANGAEIWNVVFPGRVEEVAIGADGHPVVTGLTFGSGIRTLKYDGASGAVLWDVAFTAGGNEQGRGVAVGPDGHPVVLGAVISGFDQIFRLLKYDGQDGSILWNTTFDAAGSNDVPRGLAIGPDGHPVAVGCACPDPFGPPFDFRILKLDGATGDVLWNVTFDGGAGDRANGVAIGADNNPVVTGFSGGDLRTVKYLVLENQPGAVPVGNNVLVEPVDQTTGTSPVSLTFSEVTQAGIATLSTSVSGPPPPTGFKLGNPPTYYELTTTAVFSGPVEVCIDYSGVSFRNESKLRLFHFEAGVWVDRTSSLNTSSQIICALTDSFSLFAVLEPDSQPPVADAGEDRTIECVDALRTPVPFDGSASSDPDDDIVLFEWRKAGAILATGETATVELAVGIHEIELRVTDAEGLSDADTLLVLIADTTAPVLEKLSASPDVLWPPNHRLVPVALEVAAADVCDPTPVCRLIAVDSDEPETRQGGLGGPSDWEVSGGLSVLLRAERSGSGDGRVYTLTVECTDRSSNRSIGTVTVTVPHDRRK